MQAEHKERKRSKRHRRKRNHITNKDRVDSVREYSVYAQAVNEKYKAKYAKPVAIPYF